jgi:DNA-binding MarR family transcriptional regulator
MRRLAANGLMQRVPHPTDGRTTLVQITGFGRSTVEDATVTLPAQIARCVGHRRAQPRASQHALGLKEPTQQ